jgi:hypothetical protein
MDEKKENIKMKSKRYPGMKLIKVHVGGFYAFTKV